MPGRAWNPHTSHQINAERAEAEENVFPAFSWLMFNSNSSRTAFGRNRSFPPTR
jgi:hypothetical protein